MTIAETMQWVYDRNATSFRRLLDTHGNRVARVEVLHVSADGGPFTDVTLYDARGERLDSMNHGPLPTAEVARVLHERFDAIKRRDNGRNLGIASLTVAGYRAAAK